MIQLQKIKKISLILLTLFSLIVILGACSEKTDSGNIENVNTQEEQLLTEEMDFKVEDIWMRPTEAGEDAEVYMSLNNQSNELVGLHDAMISGVSYQVSFYPGGYIEIPEGETVLLTPDDVYLIFEDIDQKMDVGDTFTISLHLTPYGDVDFQGIVEDR